MLGVLEKLEEWVQQIQPPPSTYRFMWPENPGMAVIDEHVRNGSMVGVAGFTSGLVYALVFGVLRYFFQRYVFTVRR